MAFTAKNGRRVATPTLRKWQKEIASGKRSKVEIERAELGDLTSRGKAITRLIATELGVDTGIRLR